MTTDERPHSARAEVRKQDIKERAQALFAEHGYAQTRMSDIATAAAVTKGLLYWYFENKDSLVAEVLRDVHEQLRDAQRRAVVHLAEPLEKVYVGTVASVCFILDNYRLFQVDVPFTDEIRQVYGTSEATHAADTTSALLEGQKVGTIRSDDTASELAQGNAGVVNQFCVARSRGTIKGSSDEVAHLAARYIVRGLAADPGVAESVIARHRARRRTRRSPAARR